MPFYHLLYFILAILGLGLLIFIHELGHYLVAKKCGMRIQVFSIGFGKPFYSWKRGGVKWQLCYFLLGGYVKIAGMQKENNIPPHKVKDGFYGKKPSARIAVAFAGPLVNIAFAFVLFSIIFLIGGRIKPFRDHTQIIGQLDPSSELYEKGIRAGDQITSFDGKPYSGVKDMQYMILESPSTPINVRGDQIDYLKNERKPFDYNVTPYMDPRFFDRDINTIGILAPASFLIYNADKVPIPKDAPMFTSGIQSGDRIIWTNGQLMFSHSQFVHVINEASATLSIQRGTHYQLVRIPLVTIRQLRASSSFKGELNDWHYGAQIKSKLSDASFIPYEVGSNAIVEKSTPYIDDNSTEQPMWLGENTLQPGDRILAVNGTPISSGIQLLVELQKRQAQVIVQRGDSLEAINWKLADQEFEKSFAAKDLDQMLQVLARGQRVESVGNLHLLNPVQPVPRKDFPVSEFQKKKMAHDAKLEEEQIAQIDDEQEKEQAMRLHLAYTNRLMVGVPLLDHAVIYNPAPWTLFSDTLSDIGRTLIGLFSGSLSPKWVSGPVGIVQMLHRSWGLGLGEALFWLAVISLNLGILNLLPIPPFDGGHIVFSAIEASTGKRISQKTMDRIAIAFLILIAGFALYITFHDVLRLVGLA
ncbi:MAG: site-2 protease family protein [Chlamydiales bacterium]|nr:site-2 protease family protein [Chlamydiales bacterium]